MKDICEYARKGNKYFIYGTTVFAKYCCDKLCERYGEETVIGYIESENKDKPFDGGKPVLLPEEAVALYTDSTYFMIAGFKSFEVMQNNLMQLGVGGNHIIRPMGYEPYFQIGYAKTLKRACFWPEIRNTDTDVLTKISWFIPDRINIDIFSRDALELTVRKNVHVHKISSVGTGTEIMYGPLEKRDEAFVDSGNVNAVLKEADVIFLWDLSREGEIAERYQDKVRVVDPDFYLSIDAENYCRAYYASFSQDEMRTLLDESKENFLDMQKRAEKCQRANVFGSGPSLVEAEKFLDEFEDDFNIICNSMVKNRKLLSKLRPKLLTFADICFFVSPSEYGKAFYSDLIAVQKEYDFHIIVRECQKPLIEYHYPELAKRLIGIPYAYSDEWWLIDAEHFYLKPMDNIMTDMMLPVATALCDMIGIAGCTGKSQKDTYFWEHNDSVQYEDLKPSVFSMWRAFFHKRRYDAYFDRHCQYMENCIQFGEKLGKRYVNYTTSFIPALRERTVKVDGNNRSVVGG